MELYDPATGTWSPTAQPRHGAAISYRNSPAQRHGAGPGGIRNGIDLASAELYNPAAGTWWDTGSLSRGREFHTATLLPNGKVLVAGGRGFGLVELASAELYDPATGTWSATGSLNTARYDHTATLMRNGMVLVAGGNPGELDSAELYDPATGTWSLTGSLNTPRKDHAATLLPSGMVLVTGGSLRFKIPLASAELYDPGIVVSGRGSIDGQGDEATFKFDATQSDDRPTGSFSFSDPAAGISITNAKVRTLTFNGNSADLGGTARLGNGTRVTYSVTVADNSSDGSTDTFSITLSNSYSAGGTLTSGDIRIH